MLNLLKSSLLLLFIINLSACSYSPDSLKDSYSELESSFSKDLQEPFDLSAKQRAMINNYTKQLFKWHRHTKLPAYSQNFALLAEQTQQRNPHLPSLVKVFTDFAEIPHIHEATHLTPMIVAFSKTLNNQQINQLETYLRNENKIAILEIKKTRYADDLQEALKSTFTFLRSPLKAKQFEIMNRFVRRFKDNRSNEVRAEKAWDKDIVNVLRNNTSPNFDYRLATLWNKQDLLLSGKALEIQKYNILLEAKLMKALVLSFTPEQRNQLSKQLFSISNTLNEMANE